MFTRLFWRDAVERAVKTAAQSAILALAADKVANVLTADFANVAGLAGGGALLSLLTSIASAGATGTVSPASLAQKPD